MNTKVAKDSKTAKDKAVKGNPNSGGKGTSNKVTTNGIRKAGSKSKLNDLNGGKFLEYGLHQITVEG